jgi:hypothetical protein
VFGRRRREEDYRQFIRELLLRFDRSAAEARAELDHRLAAQWEQLRIWREENREYFDALDRRLDDLHKESLAQREGLWKLIDRLDNGGTAPAG